MRFLESDLENWQRDTFNGDADQINECIYILYVLPTALPLFTEHYH